MLWLEERPEDQPEVSNQLYFQATYGSAIKELDMYYLKNQTIDIPK